MKILFVDDNEINQIVMKEMLELLFDTCLVETVDSAKEALELDVQSFDILITDINMPQINGFELYTLLREEHKYTKPIIAATALAVSGDKEKMLMHGFDAYISKPIDMQELKTTLEHYLQK